MIWDKLPLSCLYAEPSKNGVNKPTRVRGEGVRMVNMGELFKYGRIGDVPMERVPLTSRETTGSLLQEGDLLFARQSLVLEGAGKCSIVQALSEPTTFEGHLIRVRLDRKVADPDFYYYYFASPLSPVRAIVQQCAQAGIKSSDLAKLEVHHPPLDVQRRIAAILSAYDDLIENNQRRIRLLERAARLIYIEWFVRLRFPGYEHSIAKDGVPEGWARKTMNDMSQAVGGGTPDTNNRSYWDNGDVPWVIPSDITRNTCLALLDTERKITEAGLRNSSAKMLPPDTILMTSRASVGFFGLIDREVCTNQGFIAVVPNEERLRYYLLFNLIHRREEILTLAKGSTYLEINKSAFRRLSVVKPAEQMLDDFDKQVRPILAMVRTVHRQTRRLREARDLLLPKLMTGDIQV